MISEFLNTPSLRWVDLVSPSHEELQKLAEEFGLHSRLIEDVLDPEHLPKFEALNDRAFLIARAFDRSAIEDADSVQELTRKVAIFYGPGFLITIHRLPLPLIGELKERWERLSPGSAKIPAELLADLLNAVLNTFDDPLQRLENDIDQFEETLFANKDVLELLKEIHIVKRRASSLKRILWHTTNTIQRLQPQERNQASLFQDLKENSEANFVYADELLEEINALLHTQLSMASHRTNEVVRVLTVFSVFFLPLTFIVGIYGMNFQHMPELRWRFGYPFSLFVMIVVTLAIFRWFRKKGFLR